jgi:hypothetical protein
MSAPEGPYFFVLELSEDAVIVIDGGEHTVCRVDACDTPGHTDRARADATLIARLLNEHAMGLRGLDARS